MDIYIRPEILAALGVAIGSFIIAFIGLLIWMVRHLSSFAKALKAGQDVNVALNKDLRDVINERKADREAYEARERTLIEGFENERADFKRDLAKVRQDSEDAINTLTAELVKVKAKLAASENSIRALTLENERLSSRITELITEGKAKDRKIEKLSRELESKVDKADTDNVTESAAKVTPDTTTKSSAETEPGESKAPEEQPESHEEKTKDD